MKYRTLFISDLHLGTRGFHADLFIDFISQNEFEKIYIVGDFLDIWAMSISRFWTQQHTNAIRKILKRSKRIPIIYVVGNHDELCSQFIGEYGNISICETSIHCTASMEKILVLHGHQFDSVTMYAKWVSKLGDVGYKLLLRTNRYLNFCRRILRLPHWSLSAYVKKTVKDVVGFISNFEHMVVEYAEQHQASSVLCGHIHSAAIRKIGNINYYNCGDWVESCTALVENNDGRIELLHLLPEGTPSA